MVSGGVRLSPWEDRADGGGPTVSPAAPLFTARSPAHTARVFLPFQPPQMGGPCGHPGTGSSLPSPEKATQTFTAPPRMAVS